jgi:hypothetical protein
MSILLEPRWNFQSNTEMFTCNSKDFILQNKNLEISNQGSRVGSLNILV